MCLLDGGSVDNMIMALGVLHLGYTCGCNTRSLGYGHDGMKTSIGMGMIPLYSALECTFLFFGFQEFYNDYTKQSNQHQS